MHCKAKDARENPNSCSELDKSNSNEEENALKELSDKSLK